MDHLLLSQLSLKQQRRKIKVRIGRMWDAKIPTMRDQVLSLDCLLIDEKGDSMQGTIRKQDAAQFRQLLEERNVYIIENFNVIPTKRFKVVDQDYMIIIGKWTTVVKVTENVDSIRHYSFRFVSFDTIHTRRNNDACLSDVIGRIVSFGAIGHTYVGQEQTPIRNLEIEDLQKNKLDITLWDNFAAEIDEALIFEKDASGPVIIILSSMTVRTYRDKIYLSTSSASRLYVELEIPEVIEFRQKIQQPVDRIHHIHNKQQAPISPQEEMHVNRKKIADLLSLELSEIKNVKFTCEVTLKSIDCSSGWWYKACYECKSAIKSYGEAFWCSQCGKNDQAPLPWYKLDATVDDATGSANFTIFGRIAQDLIHVPAQKIAIADNSDRYELPPVIKNILGKKYIFQVVVDLHKLDMGTRSFKVIKCFSDKISIKVEKETSEPLLLTSSETTSSSKVHIDKLSPTPDADQPARKRLRFEGDDGPSNTKS